MARLFDDALTQYLRNASAILSAPPFAIALWFYSDAASTEQAFFSIATNGSSANRFSFGVSSVNRVRCTARTGSSVHATTTLNYSINTWHHAAAIFSAAARRAAYLDGGNKGSDTTSIAPTGMNETLVGLDQTAAGAAYMSGRLAEIGVWDLTDWGADAAGREAAFEAILPALTRGKLPREFPLGLVGHWPVWGNDDPEPDLSPAIVTATRYNMTLSGTPAKANHAPVTLWTPKWWSVPLIEVAAGGASVPAIMHHRRMQG